MARRAQGVRRELALGPGMLVLNPGAEGTGGRPPAPREAAPRKLGASIAPWQKWGDCKQETWQKWSNLNGTETVWVAPPAQ